MGDDYFRYGGCSGTRCGSRLTRVDVGLSVIQCLAQPCDDGSKGLWGYGGVAVGNWSPLAAARRGFFLLVGKMVRH